MLQLILLLLLLLLLCYFFGGGSSLYGLPRSILLCRDDPQAPDLTCLPRLPRLLLLLLFLLLWVWWSFVGKIFQNGLIACRPNRGASCTQRPPSYFDPYTRNGLEALPIQAHIYYVVTVCRPGYRSCRQNFFHVSIIAKVGGVNIFIELDRDVAHGDPNFPVAFVFRLKPEKLRIYCVPDQSFG